MTPSCSDCRWKEVIIAEDADGAEPAVECRRYPPTVMLHDGEAVVLWPQVAENEWCGEFQP